MTTDERQTLAQRFDTLRVQPEAIAEGLAVDIVEQTLAILDTDHISQQELAEMMDVSPSLVSRLLNTYPNVTLTTVAKLAAALGTTPAITLDAERFPICNHPQWSGTELEDAVIDYYSAGTATAPSSRARGRVFNNALA